MSLNLQFIIFFSNNKLLFLCPDITNTILVNQVNVFPIPRNKAHVDLRCLIDPGSKMSDDGTPR